MCYKCNIEIEKYLKSELIIANSEDVYEYMYYTKWHCIHTLNKNPFFNLFLEYQ